ncbi:hypothetical protein BFN03_08950 [Rhodococcus sp. WMMA185]|nr:hypothetical protein BFN03_08950 [Rhodococcus sp. WMMA185]
MSERSLGSSRIFRLAHQDPELVAIASKSRALFAQWEMRGGPIVSDCGTVISDEELEPWVSSMAAAGAKYEIASSSSTNTLRLPTRKLPSHALLDLSGGVIDVDRVKSLLTGATAAATHLEQVRALEQLARGVRIWTESGHADFDTAVITAGAGTPELAAQVGMHTPSEMEHALRLTFRLRAGVENPQCWIDKPFDGVSTYQHENTRGQWAVGAHMPIDDVAWEVGRDHAEKASARVVRNYVASTLDDVDPTEIGRVYCTHPNLGDGFHFLREGGIVAFYGDNLFKMAPFVGKTLAEAIVDGSTPSQADLAH